MDRTLDEMGISFRQLQILETLRLDPARHASAIAWTLRVQRQSLIRPLRGREQGQLIEIFELDGNVRVIGLTLAGRRRHKLSTEAIRMPLGYVCDELTEDEARTLFELLVRVQRSCEARPGSIWWRPRDDLADWTRGELGGWNF